MTRAQKAIDWFRLCCRFFTQRCQIRPQHGAIKADEQLATIVQRHLTRSSDASTGTWDYSRWLCYQSGRVMRLYTKRGRKTIHETLAACVGVIRQKSHVPVRWTLLALLPLAISACGGGGGEGDASVSTSATQSKAVAQLEIAATGTLLTQRGATSRLALTAFDAVGLVVPAGAVTWKSSDPSIISVDSDGAITAVASNGSADITAEVASGALASTTAVVTPLGPRTRVLAGDGLRAPPTAVLDSNGEPTGQFLISLNRVPAGIAEGDILAGDSPPVVGRVVAVRPGGEVLMELVDPIVAFPDLNVRSEVNFSNSQFVLAGDLATMFEVAERSADGVTYLPRARASSRLTAQMVRPAAIALGDSVKCEGESATEIKFEPQKIKIDASRVGLRRVWQEGVEKSMIVHGPLTLSVSFKVSANVAAGLTRKCSLLLGHLPLPASAPIWMLGAKLPVKIGFEVGAEAKGIEMKYELTQTETVEFDVGFKCVGAQACDWVLTATSQRDQTKTIEATRQGGRLGYKFNGFTTLAIEMSPSLIGSELFKFTLVQAKTKLEFASDTASALDQVNDPAWSANYQWRAVAAFKTFLSIDESAKAGLFLAKVITLPDPLTSELEVMLRSWGPPKLLAMQSEGAFVAGQTRTIRVSLNPDSLTMPLGGSPLSGVALHVKRQDGSFDTLPVQFVNAARDQTVFDLQVVITPEMIDGEFIAFADVSPSYLTLGNEIELGSLAIAPGKVAVVASAKPSIGVPGQTITLHADVTFSDSTRAPVGVVNFIDASNSNLLCSAAKAADSTTAECTTQFGAIGSYDVIAKYSGVGQFASFQNIASKATSILINECVVSPAQPVFGSDASLVCYSDFERQKMTLHEEYSAAGSTGPGGISIENFDSFGRRTRFALLSLDGTNIRKYLYNFSGDLYLSTEGRTFFPPSFSTPYSISVFRQEYASDGSSIFVLRQCTGTSSANLINNVKSTTIFRPGDVRGETTTKFIDVAQCPTPAEVNGLFPFEISDSRLFKMLK